MFSVYPGTGGRGEGIASSLCSDVCFLSLPATQDPSYSAACPFCQQSRFGVAYSFADPLLALPASPRLTCRGRARGSTSSTGASPALGSSTVVTVSVRDREDLQRDIMRDGALPPPTLEHSWLSASPALPLERSLRAATAGLTATPGIGPRAIGRASSAAGALGMRSLEDDVARGSSRGAARSLISQALIDDDEHRETSSLHLGSRHNPQSLHSSRRAEMYRLEEQMLQQALAESLLEDSQQQRRVADYAPVSSPVSSLMSVQPQAERASPTVDVSAPPESQLPSLSDLEEDEELRSAIALSMLLFESDPVQRSEQPSISRVQPGKTMETDVHAELPVGATRAVLSESQ